MEAYELVEAFEILWRDLPKNTPLKGRSDKKTDYAVLFSVGDLQVYAGLRVGVKGGLQEAVYVFDPSQAIVADRLIVECDGGDASQGVIFPLRELRQKVGRSTGRREIALEVCEAALQDLLARLESSPLTPRQLLSMQSTFHSLRRIMRGGLPM